MSVDHGIHSQFDPSERPIFLDVAPGMTVIVRHDYLTGERADKDWWMGQVIHCGGAARDPSIHNLFQIADVDSGVIRWVITNGSLRFAPSGVRPSSDRSLVSVRSVAPARSSGVLCSSSRNWRKWLSERP